MDLGAGNGVQQGSQGGVAKLNITTGSPTGTPGVTGIQIKITGPTSPGGATGTGPGVFCKVINGITAQTNTITFYDSATAAGCTPAAAILTLPTAAANTAPSAGVVDVPFFLGLWYAASGAFTGPMQFYFS
jgi:hypothetical protein